MITHLEQVKEILKKWKSFQLIRANQNYAFFIGVLKPIEIEYQVSLEFGKGLTYNFPIVRVITPKLEKNHDAAEEAPLPHVYFDKNDISLSPLCLFDPAQNQWSEKCLIANTTIPWTADWLACYEGWSATGKWTGGGRHPQITEIKSEI